MLLQTVYGNLSIVSKTLLILFIANFHNFINQKYIQEPIARFLSPPHLRSSSPRRYITLPKKTEHFVKQRWHFLFLS